MPRMSKKIWLPNPLIFIVLIVVERAMKTRIFNLGIGDKDNGVDVGVDKDKGVDVGVTVGGKKTSIGARKTGAKIQIPL